MAERELDQWPLGELIQSARDRAGLSVREAARAAGIAPTTWSAIESGTRKAADGLIPNKPAGYNVVAAARVVGVDVTEALELGGYDPKILNVPPTGQPAVSKRSLRDRIDMLTENQRAAVSAIVDALLNPEGPDVQPQPDSARGRRARVSDPQPGRKRATLNGSGDHGPESRSPGRKKPRQ